MYSRLFFIFLFFSLGSLFAEDNVVLKWNQASLEAIKNTSTPPTVAARALAIVHTSMFDAWAPYDKKALSTRRGKSLRRPKKERTKANKQEAISYAAYRSLVSLFPSMEGYFTDVMVELGFNPNNTSLDPSTPSGIGNLAALDVTKFRLNDGANQLGNEPGSDGSAYSDYTGYLSPNSPNVLIDPNLWQPLLINKKAQQCLTPHWGLIVPFALSSAGEQLPIPCTSYPKNDFYVQAQNLLEMSAQLDDHKKMIAEYWSDQTGTVTPPGHWNELAQYISRRDKNSIGQDVKMFFILNNAMLDSSIAVWFAKTYYNSCRPITAIRFLFSEENVLAWSGPGQGTRYIIGKEWQSYLPTPPHPEYISAHSTFASAAAEVLKRFSGKNQLGYSVTIKKGSSFVEPGITPKKNFTLRLETLTSAAKQAGQSRRYGGIHFEEGDVQGRKLGKKIGVLVYKRANYFIRGLPSENKS